MLWFGIVSIIILLVLFGDEQKNEEAKRQEVEALKGRNYQLLVQLQDFRPGFKHEEILYHETAANYCAFYRVSPDSKEREIIMEYFENRQKIEELERPILTGK